MGTSFRCATEDDAEAIARLAGELSYPVEPQQQAERLASLLDDEAHAVLVAEQADTMVGWVHVTEQLSLVAPPRGLILGLIVDPELRGAGIGRELVERAEAWASKRGLATMRVRSRGTRQAAHAFYDRLGYELSKTQRLYQRPLGVPR